jgi:hypothetical protein
LPLADAKRGDYLDAVIALQPGNEELAKRRDALRAGNADPVPDEAGASAMSVPAPAPTCDISR